MSVSKMVSDYQLTPSDFNTRPFCLKGDSEVELRYQPDGSLQLWGHLITYSAEELEEGVRKRRAQEAYDAIMEGRA